MPLRLLNHHDEPICRDKVVRFAFASCPHDQPVVVVSRDRMGRLYVASTHGADTAKHLLDKARQELE